MHDRPTPSETLMQLLHSPGVGLADRSSALRLYNGHLDEIKPDNHDGRREYTEHFVVVLQKAVPMLRAEHAKFDKAKQAFLHTPQGQAFSKSESEYNALQKTWRHMREAAGPKDVDAVVDAELKALKTGLHRDSLWHAFVEKEKIREPLLLGEWIEAIEADEKAHPKQTAPHGKAPLTVPKAPMSKVPSHEAHAALPGLDHAVEAVRSALARATESPAVATAGLPRKGQVLG